MKIVHVTTVHSPLDPRILQKECLTLVGAGFDVTIAARSVPTDRIGGVGFVSLPTAGTNRFHRIFFGKLRLLRALLDLDADLYHVHDPELLTILPALRHNGKHVVYDAHEHLHDSLLSKPYLPGRLRLVVAKAARRVEDVIGRQCSLIVAATPRIGAQFEPGRTRVVHNYPVMDDMGVAPATLEEFLGRPPQGVYVGGLSALRYADEMCEAAGLVRRRHPGARLLVAGPTDRVVEPGRSEAVDYAGAVPASEIPGLLGRARFGVVLLADTPAYSAALPTKFFEYLAAGLPVVASRSTRAITDIVTEHGCGLLVEGSDVEEVAEAMLWLLEHPQEAFEMGQRGAALARSKYNWAGEGQTLVAAYRELAYSSGDSTP